MLIESEARVTERTVRKDPAHDHMAPRPMPVVVAGPNLRSKAFVDWILAAILLLISTPAIVFAALLVKLTSRGPAFFKQERVGCGGRVFTLIKIRTMTHNCESVSGPRWSTVGDPRVTAVGRFLRRSHLDELPQLWNVLRAEMSLVGPRPERPEFVPLLEQAIPHYRNRLAVRPGLTGLAQIQLPPDTDLVSVGRKLACDLYYVQNVSLFLDLRILLSTVCYLLKIPFHWSRCVLRVPTLAVAEQAHHTLIGRKESSPHWQTA